MSFVAISFPVSSGPLAQRKNESLRRAKKFAKELGDDGAEMVTIKEGVYGFVVPSDVEREVLAVAKKHDARIIPFHESEESPVKEGTWIALESAAMGVRFEMSGTKASNAVEGKVLPGKYFVLGIEESNGGVYATLGKVAHLGEIGRQGAGRYVYNVDLNILRESLAAETKAPIKESVKKGAKEESHDRTDEILEMLLENDPYILAENARNRKGLVESDELTLEEMVNAEQFGQPKEDDKIEDGEVVEDDTTEVVADEEVSDGGEIDLTGEDNKTDMVESDELALLGGGRDILEAEEAPKKLPTVPAPKDEDELDEGFDADTFAEIRDIETALVAAGHDIGKMSEAELEEAIAKLSEANDKEDAEDSKLAAEAQAEKDAAEAATEAETEDKDESFEATPEESAEVKKEG